MPLGDFLQELKAQIPQKKSDIQAIAEDVYGGPEGLQAAIETSDSEVLGEGEGGEFLDEDLELEGELSEIQGAGEEEEELEL